MTLVNEYISLDIAESPIIESSFCKATEEQNHILLTFGLFTNDCLLDIASHNYLIHIKITKTYFEKYNHPFEICVEKQSICCNTQTKLLNLINCNLIGIERQLYLESIILFLLFQALKNSYTFELGCNNCTLVNKKVDVEKMQLAKNYILKNLAKNITIPIIANAVGTNQCYLKKGFKNIFNKTIFEFIQENRMIKAKYLLENTSLNVTEIAFTIGYASLSSFSQAYKNYFGITPLEQAQSNYS
jgi:AraC-like DNA-binding protein